MPSPINIVTRAEWMARPPVTIRPLTTPVDTVLLMYTGSADYLTTKEVLSILPEMQRTSILLQSCFDINYNWLVDYNGNIYEGRGWRTNVEKYHYSPYGQFNGKSIDIGMIGNFADKNPPRSMERVVTRLIEWGMTERFIINTRHLKIYNWKDFPNMNYDNIYIQDK
ncbi:peptidoglycan-recognition protein LF-like isoform X2 [Macrosteles quadrilineatus]|uniref:peptidoglycan-recognition protein LF-like isoform X2 n=1 Tax=Macrosteles quadrilineatus TaxID=74068 RepID=UPI0023E29ED5|nr:peptidoglycan-recognition protein LF-like isoform X2 [Macrosteles quadrilineatus]